MGIRIYIEGECDVTIVKKRKLPVRSNKKLIFLRSIIDQMEIRVESPMNDLETAYALSGMDVVDMLHKLSSSDVIISATPTKIYTVTERKIEHILKERGEPPNIIVDVHTHPLGVAELSELDREMMKKVAEIFKDKIPGVKVYFGVHAFSEEKFGKRIEPVAVGNRIRWRSIMREHEIAVFDENGRPVVVDIWSG